MQMQISGEYISDMAKKIVLRGNWEGAIRILTNDNEDFNGDYNTLYKILNGDMKLIGMNDEIEAINDFDIRYKKELLELYGKLVWIQDAWYKPYSWINTIKEGDRLIDQRTLFYKENEEDKHLFVTIKGERKLVLFQESEFTVPVWLEQKQKGRTPEQILSLMKKDLIEYGVTNESLYTTSQKGLLNDILKYQKREDMISSKAFNDELDAREQIKLEVYRQEIIKKRNRMVSN
jgi:hypothetical protein